ncbi:MAG: ABC transporter permease [Candidatus Euphemobacter frigidus]|nr:ABC transporter permease [Candidatus Euphemobacter frigidus]MDP8275263.1 ABC transporter permease [Candidatus Euphemobacter frigidus]
MNLIEKTGGKILDSLQGVGGTIVLLFRGLYWFKTAVKYRVSIFDQMLLCGVESMPVVMVVAIFSGMVVALQTGHELARFQLEGTIGNIVAASICREMGPVFAAIIVAGRVGSAMAAQLGTMKVSEEIDALEAMAINPVRYLVMPRVWALLFMLPILTIFADLVGILGGGMVSRLQIGISYYTFFDGVMNNLEIKDIYVGMVKAVVFGLTIAAVSCYQGLNAKAGARGVGRATTRSLVFSFLSILIFDYFITAIFY